MEIADVFRVLDSHHFSDLAGINDILQLLEEAGVAKEPILVCTGRGFADSLSASATGYPGCEAAQG